MLLLPYLFIHLSSHDLAPEGLFRKWGVLDFAGGTVVHMSAGLALYLVLFI